MERRKRECGACYRVKKIEVRSFVQNDEPSMRRTADTGRPRREREIEAVDFVGGEVKKGFVRKHEHWELRW